MSQKRADKIGERSALRQQQLFRKPLCEGKLEGCRQKASDVHEIINRSQRSTAWLEPEMFISLCRPCHKWVTEHPLWSRHHGMSLSAYQSTPQWLDAAAHARLQCHNLKCLENHVKEPK